MTDIAFRLEQIKKIISPFGTKLIAVSKTYPPEIIKLAFDEGQIDFGENKVQEMLIKHDVLPKNVNWHLIGHLQTNKIRPIIPFVSLIHSVDRFKLLKDIDKEAARTNRTIACLLQIHIAEEESKYGFAEKELWEMLSIPEFEQLKNIKILGLMGMATNTDDKNQIRNEFKSLRKLFEEIKSNYSSPQVTMQELSMGMSNDFLIACEEGSTMVRIGSSVFGLRNGQI